MPNLSDRVGTFTDSVIRRMTRICNKYNAINLSQGFPDWEPPKEMLDALAKASYAGPHQYAITFGAKNLRDAICEKQSKRSLLSKTDASSQIFSMVADTDVDAMS